jgi:hypothetical protein
LISHDRGKLSRDVISAYRMAHPTGPQRRTSVAYVDADGYSTVTQSGGGAPMAPLPPSKLSQQSIDTVSGKVTIYTVKSATGTDVHLQAKSEADWYRSQREKYQSQNHFTNISDLQDLDRLLTLEVMVHRWSTWLTQGFNYDGEHIEPHMLKSNIADYSKEIRAIKAALGIDRVTRDKDKGETVGDYLTNLLRRAKEFGVQRNKEYETAVTLMWELINRVQTYDRCDDLERRDLNLSPESILEWVRTQVIPEWNTITTSFQDDQRMWIRTL